MRNKRPFNKFTEYRLENKGVIYGNYATFEKAKEIADSLDGYSVIRRGDEKVWES